MMQSIWIETEVGPRMEIVRVIKTTRKSNKFTLMALPSHGRGKTRVSC